MGTSKKGKQTRILPIIAKRRCSIRGSGCLNFSAFKISRPRCLDRDFELGVGSRIKFFLQKKFISLILNNLSLQHILSKQLDVFNGKTQFLND